MDAEHSPCPAWCVVRHGAGSSEEDAVHVGGALLVRRTVLRLCTTIDAESGSQDGPFVLLGDEELTVHEAESLAAALTQLVDQAASSLAAEQAQCALPVLDA